MRKNAQQMRGEMETKLGRRRGIKRIEVSRCEGKGIKNALLGIVGLSPEQRGEVRLHSLHPPAAGGSYQDGGIVRYCDASLLPRGDSEPGVEDLVAIQSDV